MANTRPRRRVQPSRLPAIRRTRPHRVATLLFAILLTLAACGSPDRIPTTTPPSVAATPVGTPAGTPGVATPGTPATPRTHGTPSVGTGVLTGHTGAVRAIAYSPDGRTIASAGADGTVRLWDTVTGATRRVLREHKAAVNAVAFSPDGRLLVSGGKREPEEPNTDPTERPPVPGQYRGTPVIIWDVATGAIVNTIRYSGVEITSLAFTTNGYGIAIGDDNGSLSFFGIAEPRNWLHISGWPSKSVQFAFRPDGKMVVTNETSQNSTDGPQIRLVDISSGRDVRGLRDTTANVWSVAYSHDGKTIASAGPGATVTLWNGETGVRRRELTSPTGQYPVVVAFSPDNAFLAVGGSDSNAALWHLATSQVVRVLSGHADRIASVAFAPDGRTLATGSDDGTIRLWDVDDTPRPVPSPTPTVARKVSPPRGLATPGPNLVPAGWSIYESIKFPFAIALPPDWISAESLFDGLILFRHGDPTRHSTLLVAANNQDALLEELAEDCPTVVTTPRDEPLPTSIPLTGGLVRCDDTSSGGGTYSLFVATGTHNGVAWLLIFATTEADYPADYQDMFLPMVRSFTPTTQP